MRERILGAVMVAVFAVLATVTVRKAVVAHGDMGTRPFTDIVVTPLTGELALEVKLGLDGPARPLGLSLPGGRLVFRVHVRNGTGPYRAHLRCQLRDAGETYRLVDSRVELPARSGRAFVAGLAADLPGSAPSGRYDCQLMVTDSAGEKDGAARLLRLYSQAEYDAELARQKRIEIATVDIRDAKRPGKDLRRFVRGETYQIRVGFRRGMSQVALRLRLTDGAGTVREDRQLGQAPVRPRPFENTSLVTARWRVPAGPAVQPGLYSLVLELSEGDQHTLSTRNVFLD